MGNRDELLQCALWILGEVYSASRHQSQPIYVCIDSEEWENLHIEEACEQAIDILETFT